MLLIEYINNNKVMLTEKEAWLKIAGIFSQPAIESSLAQLSRRYLPEDVNKSYSFRGICNCLNAMNWKNLIDQDTKDIMDQKMEDYCIKYDLDPEEHFWPRTEEGDKQRVQFCIDRANEL